MTGLENRRKVYLDYAATTPIREEVKQRMMELLEGPHGNASSTHQFGRKSKIVIEEARKYIAKALNCTGNEIVFTSGGTEADNAALLCSVRDLGVKRIITSPIEHHAVLHTAEAMAKHYHVRLEFVDLKENGEVDLNSLSELLEEDVPTLVSLMHGNNEIGNLLDLKAVGDLCHSRNAYFHTDTVQTIGHYEIDLSELNIDFLAASSHKFYGPKGVGFMYINHRLKVWPLIEGGAQERNRRGGTENILGIGGLHEALRHSLEKREEENAHILGLKKYMIERLQAELEEVGFNGRCADFENSLVAVLSARFPSLPKDNMHLFTLDMQGIAVSGGSACSSGSQQGSHVIQTVHPDVDYPVIRFSFGKDNTREEVDYVVEVLKKMEAPVAKEM